MTLKGLTRRRSVAAGAAVAVLVAGGAVVWARQGSSASTQYRTAAAALGTVTQSLALTGNLSPLGESDLNFGSAGRVSAVNVQPGQSVKAGQVLATLDTASLQASLTQAQATLSSAQAKLSLDQAGPTAQSLQQSQAQVNSAQNSLQNAQTSLRDTQTINQQSVASGKETEAQAQQSNDQAQAQVNSAQVQLQNAQAALAALQQGSTTQQVQMDQSQVQIDQINVDNATKALSQGSLVAPVDGVVGVVNITTGQSVSGSSGSSSSSSSSPQISVLTPGAFQVTGTVSDTQVNDIVVGQRALVTPAGSTQAVKAQVTGIAAEATVTSGVATFPVTISLSGSNPSLHAGVSASIVVVTNQVVGVLTVPTSAVRGSTVQVLVNGQPQTVQVTTGASDSTRTQILSGLNVGDNVIIATVTSTVPSSTTGTTGGGLLGGGGGRGGAGALGRTLGGG